MERSMPVKNQNAFGMAEVLSPNLTLNAQTVANRPSSLSRSLLFKYYIHDSVSTLRFQLIGDLRTGNLMELDGSWETAQTTLGPRRFLLDLNQLFSADEAGRDWLLKMEQVGAQLLPANYMNAASNGIHPQIPEQTAAVKLSLLGRVMGLFGASTSRNFTPKQ
jgi:hypothetical protein